MKEKDEPLRMGKGNDNLRIAVEHLKSDLDGYVRETEDQDRLFAEQEKIHKRYEE